ncbi:MAG: efflux RND transporter periplasmic adaptor subunit [Alphaproteobacteria bacterium]|nr:efflux RND transporter periplasmic adaptor subunit [Alphaproteobacteria bacterium]MBU0794758.1 efflux RND transporter periplasmic adaptor subunit [Alphaproteobacteria bacterium]MBU0874341.1 efflux RND transporter periplasmic adaptor subunit [Alphaproteobacteria bacterium]MBU1769673.1 efflux RND transporter periplasmic adaptor subunit [Alphaproteobacteria bacterium]
MRLRLLLPLTPLAAFALLPACSDAFTSGQGDEDGTSTGEASDPLAALAIQTAAAEREEELPLGTVPGVISLPPEARVAVTSTFQGAVMRLFVIEGQEVRRGQALALVRAAEPVQIRGDLARSQAELGLALARAARVQQLTDEGVIAAARADEAQALLQQARASVAENRRLISLSGASADGTMTLAAPISGRVQHVGVETGGPIDAMSAPFVIENASAYRIDLQLPERMARSVRPGMAVEITLPKGRAEPLVVGGSILSVSPSIDPTTRSVMAKASIGAAPGLVPGQNVMVTIRGSGQGRNGVSVPASAVTRIGDADQVFVQGGQGYAPRPVIVVAEAGDRAVISAGLAPGEVVAISAIAELKAMAAE